jgi:hypothetical protein
VFKAGGSLRDVQQLAGHRSNRPNAGLYRRQRPGEAPLDLVNRG